MKILMIGAGKGSWEMRGVQLGGALGARVTSLPTEADWRWCDVAILVKRAGFNYPMGRRPAGVPVVWDALDFWRQPAQNGLQEPAARRLFAAAIEEIAPLLVIGATEAMAAAAGDRGAYLPHHGHLNLWATPARETCRAVAYDGNPIYLGNWLPALHEACRRRGWTVLINPPDLTHADLIVSFRDGQWDGWMCREWKSGVKLVNAILSGRPIIRQDSAANREIFPPGTVIERIEALDVALDLWTSHHDRDFESQRADGYRLDAIAMRYRGLLAEALERAA